MNTLLVLLIVTAVVTITYSLPMSKYLESDSQSQHEIIKSDLKGATSWQHFHANTEEIEVPETLHQLKFKYNLAHTAARTILDTSEVIKGLQEISSNFTLIVKALADFINKRYKKEYGIKDPLNEELLKIRDFLLFWHNASNSKLVDCRHYNQSSNIINSFNKFQDVFDFFVKKIFEMGNISTDGCPQVSSKVDTIQPAQPMYVWMKKFQARTACTIFRRLGKNMTDQEEDAYKQYFDVVITLYEHRVLTDELDKEAFKRAMNFLLKKINSTGLPSAAKRSITELTRVCMKIILGGKLSLMEKFLIAKNAAILLKGHLTGTTVALFKEQPLTLQMGTSLLPIVLNMYISTGYENCKERSDPNYEAPLLVRKIFTYAMPVFKKFVQKFASSLPDILKSLPIYKATIIPSVQVHHREYFEKTHYDKAMHFDNVDSAIPREEAKMSTVNVFAPADTQKKIKRVKLLGIILQ